MTEKKTSNSKVHPQQFSKSLLSGYQFCLIRLGQVPKCLRNMLVCIAGIEQLTGCSSS